MIKVRWHRVRIYLKWSAIDSGGGQYGKLRQSDRELLCVLQRKRCGESQMGWYRDQTYLMKPICSLSADVYFEQIISTLPYVCMWWGSGNDQCVSSWWQTMGGGLSKDERGRMLEIPSLTMILWAHEWLGMDIIEELHGSINDYFSTFEEDIFFGGGERRVLPKNDIISDLYRLFRGSVMPFNNCP